MSRDGLEKILFNKIFYEEFKRLAFLTEQEIKVIQGIISDITLDEQEELLCMCRRKISNIRNDIRIKYDCVQPFSEILPVRQVDEEECSCSTCRCKHCAKSMH